MNGPFTYTVIEYEPDDAATSAPAEAGRPLPGSLSPAGGRLISAPGVFVPRLRVLLESLTCDTCFYLRAGYCPGTGGAIRPCDLALADLDALEAAQ